MTKDEVEKKNNRANYEYEDEIDLFELLNKIWRRKKLIIALVLSVSLLTLILSFVMTPMYRATAKIIPLKSKSIPLVLPSEVLNVLGAAGIGGGDTSSNIIKAILGSRELAKNVIERTGIEKYLYGNLWDENKGKLKENLDPHEIPSFDELADKFQRKYVSVNEDRKTGVIDISTTFPKYPTLAALIANTYIYELENILKEKSYTIAKKNRVFVEGRVENVRERLREAEEKLKEFQEKYNVVAIDKQMEEGIKLYAQLVALLSEKEVKLEVLRNVTTSDNPEVLTLEYEIKELKNKIKELEDGQRSAKVKGYILNKDRKLLIPLDTVPDLALEYVRIRREFEMQNQLYTVLMTALEKARIDEEKEDISFEVVDWAYPPRYRYKPKRKLMVALAFVSSLFSGILVALLLDSIQNRRKNQGKEKDEK